MVSQNNGTNEPQTQANNMADSPQMKVGRIQFNQAVDDSISHGTKTSTQYTFTIRAGTSTTDFWTVEQIVPSSTAFERFFCNTTSGNTIHSEQMTLYDGSGGGGLLCFEAGSSVMMADSPQMKVGRIQFNQAVDESIEANQKMGQYRDYNEMSMTDCEGKKVTIQYHWDTDIYGTMEIVMRLLIANGFSPDTVKDGFSYMWNEYYMDESKESENESMVELLEWVQEMNLGNLSPSVIVKLYNKDIPNGMCNDCGTSSGAKVDEGCTWWKGVCEVCGDYKEVTDERDYR